ncbi:hypothetical protein EOT10_22720 [Streptomyces antnestii]|uniref:Uncharacterized protein n=1 Tax=Streptomyces antnestii TaxID=2494256 RepID=A0A437PIZ7_9ACTN|nr:hypothetical protein [Streptomyces sp. San01]RVU22262.1 hypothetical protein EOT10_22720 [Streptomyces sp. San01]
MVITQQDNGAQTVTGTALLLAAAPANKSCLIDATSVLPALAAVPPSALAGTASATVVELADPVDPQTVLTRVRTAAAAPGPLTLYVAGQLHLDHRQRLLHLALARTTPATLRYTALPWHWLTGELALRRPDTTTVVLDLVADADAWQQVRAGAFGLGPGIRVYGRVTPPPQRRKVAAPAYLRTYASIWRNGHRPPLAHLHAQAASESGPADALFFAADSARTPTPVPTVPAPAPAPEPVAVAPARAPEAPDADPHPAILAAAQSGRHGEAAALAAMWESRALRTHGAGSPEALHWLEVRADLARLAREPARSCELWMAAAEARLARGQAPGTEDVEAAVDRAHHQWEQLGDPARARALAAPLTRLRRAVPGRRPGALEAIGRRIEALEKAPATP